MGMCQFRDSLYIKKSLLWIAGQFSVEKSCVLINTAFPFIEVCWIFDPAAFDIPFVHEPDGELLKGASITLCCGDKIAGFIHIFLDLQKRLASSHYCRHPR